MPISSTVKKFMQDRGIPYDLVPHPRTFDAMHTAAAAHVPGDRLAKAVLLGDDGGYVLAVVPSTHRIDPNAVEQQLHRHMHLASEGEISRVFADCDLGAVPPIGGAYGVETVVDESLDNEPEVYLEAGDHEDLIRVSRDRFHDIMETARHGHISRHV